MWSILVTHPQDTERTRPWNATIRDAYKRKASRQERDGTDAGWDVIAPFRPPPCLRGRPRTVAMRDCQCHSIFARDRMSVARPSERASALYTDTDFLSSRTRHRCFRVQDGGTGGPETRGGGGYAGEKRRSRLRERGISDLLEIRQKSNTITRVTVLSRRWVGEWTCAGLAVTVGGRRRANDGKRTPERSWAS